ncbi:MAG: hypothetical protein AAF603_08660 [Pseudomonadota bacterium]
MSNTNQNGINLPSAPLVTGQDIVRSADGITCQAAVASAGPYLDAGLIGTNDIYERDSVALYGRVVVPLGKRGRRVDCTRLYDLEIKRLHMEVALMQMSQVETTHGSSLLSQTELPVNTSKHGHPHKDHLLSHDVHAHHSLKAEAKREEAQRPVPPPISSHHTSNNSIPPPRDFKIAQAPSLKPKMKVDQDRISDLSAPSNRTVIHIKDSVIHIRRLR